MAESDFGREDSRGDWSPDKPISYGPLFVWPPKPSPSTWFFEFQGTCSRNLAYAIAAVGIWFFLTPSLDNFQKLSVFWFGVLLVRNLVLALIVYGTWHLWLYVFRKQGRLNITENGYVNSKRFTLIIRPMTTCSGHWQVGCPSGHAMSALLGPIQMAMRR